MLSSSIRLAGLRRFRLIRCQSTSVETKDTTDKTNIFESKDIKWDKVKTVFSKKPKNPARSPLLKNFFNGQFDSELIAFPEVINRDDMAELYKTVDQSKEFFRTINSDEINKAGMIPSDVVEGLRKLDAFATDVPHSFGGTEFRITESCLRGETEAQDVNIMRTLNVHRLVTHILNESGSDEQKSKFLPLLAKGDILGTVAFIELDLCPNGIFNTTAKTSLKGGDWTLNGKKSFVINAKNADLFLVFAGTQISNKCGDKVDGMTAFLIESDMNGVEVKEGEETLGCNGVKQCDVTFNNVELGQAHVIGTFETGSEVAQKLLIKSRLQAGILSLVMMKKIVNTLTKYCIDGCQSGVNLMELDLFKNSLAKAVSDIYALESMIYLTAGIFDDYENADVDLETAVVKVFAQRSLLRVATLPLNFMGPKAIVNGEPLAECLKDALHLNTHGESPDSLEQYIGLTGLQHVGLSIAADIKKIRNPLMNPSYIFKRLYDNKNIENLKQTLHVNHYLHPTMDPAAQWLEFSILRLFIASETLLARHSVQIMDKQIEVRRLSECAISTYAMFASVSRASRSYCIGLQFCDFEMLIASAFSFDHMLKVLQLVRDIHEGPYMTNDMNYVKISKQIFKEKGYFSIHPLTRNF
ncbi:Complex I assembly factor ACAD9, mitochondrial [Pseudolycoriella hygida]|uniref:Complex I assembly factor ACAD9, mitochondrial n=1 Tax=Pseudolycoriella hygida TaxID=35572 RepID=A0A9Q0S0R6_9DIPT|nr:Complex I assembly factor ACAD9, mitochondrial [Pseudolycoriella hygida]